ncbi:hypothetical protein BLOT_003072 [Blomia tropicalis]|nr:hypothetical protein BLOT_003072 [Blomia tropicalis]
MTEFWSSTTNHRNKRTKTLAFSDVGLKIRKCDYAALVCFKTFFSSGFMCFNIRYLLTGLLFMRRKVSAAIARWQIDSSLAPEWKEK